MAATRNRRNPRTEAVTTSDYIARRDAEHRANCVSCGTTDAACTRGVLSRGRACCFTCGYTDTHPKPGKRPDAEPCSRCKGSGVEPHDEDDL
jgi:hypothetical protein